jgi:hypothetical protein
MTASANKSNSDLAVDNLEATAFLESDAVTETDIRANKYDDADVELRIVNWSDLTQGDMLLRKGTLGNMKMRNGLYSAELRGLAHKLTAQIGATYGPICRATFGSGLNGIDMTSQYLCHFDVTTVRQTGHVVAVVDPYTLTPSALTSPPGFAPPPQPTAQLAPTVAAQVHRQNDWSNLNNVLTGAGQFATATLYGSNNDVNESSLIQVTGFHFAIPANARIVGVWASVIRQQSAGTSAVYDDSVALLGVSGGKDHSNASAWAASGAPSGPLEITYGGPSDTWGAANLSPAQVNAAGFGLQLGAECTLNGTGAVIGLDSVAMIVYYIPAGGTASAGWFNDGFITFTSGALNGASFEVKTWDGTNLKLFLALPALPAAGDTFTIEAGCDKTAATCQNKFKNIVNFRGENFIPGMDQLLDYASG